MRETEGPSSKHSPSGPSVPLRVPPALFLTPDGVEGPCQAGLSPWPQRRSKRGRRS